MEWSSRDSFSCLLAFDSCISNMKVHPEMLMKTKDRKYGTQDTGHVACGFWLVTPSSRLLFSKERRPPWSEGDRPHPRVFPGQRPLTPTTSRTWGPLPSRDGRPLPSARSVVPFRALPRGLNHHSPISNRQCLGAGSITNHKSPFVNAAPFLSTPARRITIERLQP